MPKPIGHRSADYSRPRPAPPCGQVHLRAEPHTPWQRLIEARRVEIDPPLSLRDLAQAAKIPMGTLFNWLRHPEGAPPRKRYSATINARLAKALRLEPADLAAAYDSSRLSFASRAPNLPLKLLATLRDQIEKDPRRSLPKRHILQLLETLQDDLHRLYGADPADPEV